MERRNQSGSQSSRFRHSSASHNSQMRMISSIAVVILSRCGTSKRPALVHWLAVNRPKCKGMELTSCETRTRCSRAARARTAGSFRPRSPNSWAEAKSIAGSRRRTPVRIALFRSASARNRIFTMIEWYAFRREFAQAAHAVSQARLLLVPLLPSISCPSQRDKFQPTPDSQGNRQLLHKPPQASACRNSDRSSLEIRRGENQGRSIRGIHAFPIDTALHRAARHIRSPYLTVYAQSIEAWDKSDDITVVTVRRFA